KVFETHRLAVEIRQREWRSWLRWVVPDHTRCAEVRRRRERGAGERDDGEGAGRDQPSDHVDADLAAGRRSSAVDRSSGVCMTFTNLTTPCLSMTKYARFA